MKATGQPFYLSNFVLGIPPTNTEESFLERPTSNMCLGPFKKSMVELFRGNKYSHYFRKKLRHRCCKGSLIVLCPSKSPSELAC